jgi:hypothetical protein
MVRLKPSVPFADVVSSPMRRIWLLQLTLLVLVLGSSPFPQASVMMAMSLAELTSAAESIVVGDVRSVHCAWDDRHRTIVSTIDVEVTEVWKGALVSKQLTVVMTGGTVGDIEMTVQGMPTFSLGERSLLFVRGKPLAHVVGMSQGKRTLVWDHAASQWLALAPSSDGVVEVGPDARLRQSERQHIVSLKDLHEQVKRVLGTAP